MYFTFYENLSKIICVSLTISTLVSQTGGDVIRVFFKSLVGINSMIQYCVIVIGNLM